VTPDPAPVTPDPAGSPDAAPGGGRRPRVGLLLPMFSGDPTRVVQAARDAEDLGFDGVFAFDHLFAMGGPPDRPSLEPLASLAAVGAVTSRIVVGTLVARAVLRSPPPSTG
jgi:alkanesulfonate monooxygenase SsuD/methylene tetrahydromethanopterin reductase-like flavin-dependent oxidoreductase (luciferase family)